MTTRASASLLRVLTDGHRECLQRLTEVAAANTRRRRIKAEEYDRLALRVAVQLIGEDVLVEPVIIGVLTREGTLTTRRADIAFVIRHLARAGDRIASQDVFDPAIGHARHVYEELTNRTQIEILPYMHYVFGLDDERRIADVFPRSCALTASRYRQQVPDHGPWADPELADTLRALFLEELCGAGLPELWETPLRDADPVPRGDVTPH